MSCWAITSRKTLDETWAVGRKAALLRFVRPLINGGQAQRCDALHDNLAIAEEDG